ncbi:MAG: alpha/beta hydrolase [Chitinophagales bacterium]|nr:MAG: alpha/beta hydrolase [Chitinophagales bacterium]
MEKTFTFNKITGYYQDRGSGLPVVLLHGFGEDGAVWDYVAEHLQSDCRVIIPDLPGYRHSALPSEQMSIEWMADFVFAILENERLFNPVIIGHSMGGYVTLALTEKHPDLPSKIGLFHSHAFADDEEKKKSRQRAIELIQQKGTEPFIDELYNNLFSPRYVVQNADKVTQMKKRAYLCPAETLTGGLRAMMQRPDRIHVLQSFHKPILFILGKQDKAIPYEKSLQQCQYARVSQVHLFEESGHMGMLEEPDKAVQVTREFINL